MTFGLGCTQPPQLGGRAFEGLFSECKLFERPDDVPTAFFKIAKLIEGETAQHSVDGGHYCIRFDVHEAIDSF